MTETETTEETAPPASARMGAPRGPMVSIGLVLDPELLARLDRMRACMGESRGKVIDAALRGDGLVYMEHKYAASLDTWARLAEQIDVSWVRLTQAYAHAFARQTYPPTVDTLADTSKGSSGAEYRRAIRIALRELAAAGK